MINNIATRRKVKFIKLPYCLTLDIVYLHLFNGITAINSSLKCANSDQAGPRYNTLTDTNLSQEKVKLV